MKRKTDLAFVKSQAELSVLKFEALKAGIVNGRILANQVYILATKGPLQYTEERWVIDGADLKPVEKIEVCEFRPVKYCRTDRDRGDVILNELPGDNLTYLKLSYFRTDWYLLPHDFDLSFDF